MESSITAICVFSRNLCPTTAVEISVMEQFSDKPKASFSISNASSLNTSLTALTLAPSHNTSRWQMVLKYFSWLSASTQRCEVCRPQRWPHHLEQHTNCTSAAYSLLRAAQRRGEEWRGALLQHVQTLADWFASIYTDCPKAVFRLVCVSYQSPLDIPSMYFKHWCRLQPVVVEVALKQTSEICMCYFFSLN